jgi:hypothetical protein
MLLFNDVGGGDCLSNRLLIIIAFISSDTPHHLKNKRVHHNINDKSANLLLNSASLKLKESLPPITTMQEGLSIEHSDSQEVDHEQSGKCH